MAVNDDLKDAVRVAALNILDAMPATVHSCSDLLIYKNNSWKSLVGEHGRGDGEWGMFGWGSGVYESPDDFYALNSMSLVCSIVLSDSSYGRNPMEIRGYSEYLSESYVTSSYPVGGHIWQFPNTGDSGSVLITEVGEYSSVGVVTPLLSDKLSLRLTGWQFWPDVRWIDIRPLIANSVMIYEVAIELSSASATQWNNELQRVAFGLNMLATLCKEHNKPLTVEFLGVGVLDKFPTTQQWLTQMQTEMATTSDGLLTVRWSNL